MFGYLGTDGGHGSPVKEILVGTGKMGHCNWLYDYSGPTVSLSLSLAPVQSETCFHRYQVRLLQENEEKVLREQISRSKVKADCEVALFEPSGTSFGDDDWRMLSSPFDRNPFLPQGKYVHDKTTGRHDSHSLMLKPESSVTLEAAGGAAFFGEVWTDADNLMAEAWVKTEELDGKGVRMVLKDVTNKKTYESSFVNRASEWQRLSIPLPGNIKLFHLQIEKDGKGKAWIDDISIQKATTTDRREKQ